MDKKTAELFLELVGEDEEKVAPNIERARNLMIGDSINDVVSVRNALRAELRQKVKDLTNE